MPQITNAALAASYTNVIANEVLTRLRRNPILAQMVKNTDDLRVAFTTGNTIDIILDPTFTATDAVVGVGKSYQTPTQTKISLSLDYFKEVAAQYTDLDTVIANPSLTLGRYASRITDAITEAVERQIYFDSLNDADVPLANEIGVSTNAINEDTFLALDEAFANAEVNDATKKVVILTPAHYRQALKIARITQNDTAGLASNNPIITAKLADVYGMQIYRSTYLPTNLSLTSVAGTDTNKVSIAFAADSILFNSRPLSDTSFGGNIKKSVSQDGFSVRMKMYEDENLNVYRMVADVLFGVKVAKRPTSTVPTGVATVYPILGGV
jgi:hypothetical protein